VCPGLLLLLVLPYTTALQPACCVTIPAVVIAYWWTYQRTCTTVAAPSLEQTHCLPTLTPPPGPLLSCALPLCCIA
jgi:hypothetical protein